MQSQLTVPKFLTGIIGLTLLSPLPAVAVPDSVVYNAPPPPDGIGAPTGRRDGGASRGNCPDYGDLAALVPITDGIVWGQTTAAQPTLWFYLPAAVTSEQSMELVINNGADETLYMTTVVTDVEAGTIAISPSVTLPIDTPHYWTLVLYCDPAQPATSVFVSGTIERVAADSVEPLLAETVPSLALAQDYASAGIWHDALTVLGALQQTEAGDNQRDSQILWTTLLEQVGLESATDAPIQPCCEVE